LRHAVALADAVKDALAIGIDIADEEAGVLPVLDQLMQRAARLHDVGRQLVHLQVTPIDQNNAALRIEHVQALRHVVDGAEQPSVLGTQAAMQHGGDGQRGNAKTGKQHGLAREGRWHKGSEHAGSRIELCRNMVASNCDMVKRHLYKPLIPANAGTQGNYC
jgi:hypothetical protein